MIFSLFSPLIYVKNVFDLLVDIYDKKKLLGTERINRNSLANLDKLIQFH